MIGQTLIPVQAENELTFSNFIVGENGGLLKQLNDLVDALIETNEAAETAPGIIYLWAESGAGKTHLLHGVCDQARTHNLPCQFLSLSDADIETVLNDQVANGHLFCVDNLQVITAAKNLEVAFLSFYERVKSAGGYMIAAARKPPGESGFLLADLVSRLRAGSVWRVSAMSDGDKHIALQQRAEVRGFRLNDQVIDFVMSHFARDTVSLFALLDRLDRASLAHQRKITVPFIKEVIGA
ncbi:MAG: DnaA regulatory inactivator Hda [Acidiferrobacterales bacterium]|nr:DnaA regulatory inactivator Hda [Acidiferrobacterales bacterium]